MKQENKIRILKCGHCGYSWDYGGKAKFYASCPRCRYLVKTAEKKEEKK